MPPSSAAAAASASTSNIHTVFSAECNSIFDWHSIALFHSHEKVGQPGGITRLLACSAVQLRTYQGLDIGPTFVHHNHRGDEKMNYAAFNKPASVNYWVHSGAVPAGVEFVMQLDADMVIHRPLVPETFSLAEGVVLSAPYDYLIGTHTGLPDVFGVKNKHLMARVGGVHVFHVNDLRRIAPHWLNYTERVRDFACREPDRYYELAAPGSDRKDQTQEGKGRRRQFMWMVEMCTAVRATTRPSGEAEAAPCPRPRACGRCAGRWLRLRRGRGGREAAHCAARPDAVHRRRGPRAGAVHHPLRHRLAHQVEGRGWRRAPVRLQQAALPLARHCVVPALVHGGRAVLELRGHARRGP